MGEASVITDRIAARFGVTPGLVSPTKLPGKRGDLPVLFREFGCRYGAEIGVSSGKFSKQLCLANPNLTLLCVDPYLAYDGYVERWGDRLVEQMDLDVQYLTAQQRLCNLPCTFLKAYSVDAAKAVPDESLDFVYIDANHSYLATKADLEAWIPKVKRGGLVAGHDYTDKPYHKSYGVVPAVHAIVEQYGIHPWYVLDANYLWERT